MLGKFVDNITDLLLTELKNLPESVWADMPELERVRFYESIRLAIYFKIMEIMDGNHAEDFAHATSAIYNDLSISKVRLKNQIKQALQSLAWKTFKSFLRVV